MKLAIVIAVCKFLRWLGGLLGKGSSLPGQIALKLDPQILSKVRLPERIVAVTGSNGKTSTVEMIARILTQRGEKVAWNREGSNQIEGVATLVLCDCDFKGNMHSDLLLLESDERFARYTFRHFQPTHYVITNLYRDQLTRNGHPEWVYAAIEESIAEGTQLILNADDPLVSCLGEGREQVAWFGVDRLPSSTETFSGRYNDGAFCPRCKNRMEYEYYHFNHIGGYLCPFCGHRRPKADFAVTGYDEEQGVVTINESYEIPLNLKSMYNVYNILAAFSACSLLGVPGEEIAQSISHYVLHNGRVVTFRAGDKEGILLTSKHENSVSYDQSIQFAVRSGGACTVIIIVDAVSRKYFTSETSWLWDINFEALGCDAVRRIFLTGKYCYDLAVRFEYSGIPQERVEVIPSIPEAVEALGQRAEGTIYAITCFSDKDKLLSRVEKVGDGIAAQGETEAEKHA